MSLFARGESRWWLDVYNVCVCVCGVAGGILFFEEGAKLRAVSTVTGKAL